MGSLSLRDSHHTKFAFGAEIVSVVNQTVAQYDINQNHVEH